MLFLVLFRMIFPFGIDFCSERDVDWRVGGHLVSEARKRRYDAKIHRFGLFVKTPGSSSYLE